LGILRLSCKRVMVVTCVDAQASAVNTMRGETFRFCACNSSKSGWYLLSLAVIVSGENLSLQYANSMNWMVILWSGAVGELP
jgi:hypothetical protein